jgi:hypothetical protein
VSERNGTFASTFIKKLQQASSDDRILHQLYQYARHPAHQQLTPADTLPFGTFWYGEPSAISNAIGLPSFSADRMTL